jgi:Mg-chelatase subunit ChlI
MCCLKYEQDAYEDLLRRTPKEESFVDTPEGRGTVVTVQLLRQQVKVQMEDSPETFHVFHIDDIAVLRNGKAKKSDPPIPANLAPISGNGKRRRKQEPVEDERILDPIKFRYRDENVADETTQPDPDPMSQEAAKSRRRRRHNKAETRKEAPAAQPEPEEAPVHEEQEEPNAEKVRKNNHHRRRHHRPKSKPHSATE